MAMPDYYAKPETIEEVKDKFNTTMKSAMVGQILVSMLMATAL